MASFLAEISGCFLGATIIWQMLAVTSKTWFPVFSPTRIPLSTWLMSGWVGAVVLEQAAVSWTFLSALSITRAIHLVWSKFNFFSTNKCLRIWSSTTYNQQVSPNISWIVGPNLQNFDCFFRWAIKSKMVWFGYCQLDYNVLLMLVIAPQTCCPVSYRVWLCLLIRRMSPFHILRAAMPSFCSYL